MAACREKWKNIRGRYVKQMNYPPSGSAAKPKSSYYLAEHLDFLDMFIKIRKPRGNVKSPESPSGLDTSQCHFGSGHFGDTEESVQQSDTSNTSTSEPDMSRLPYKRKSGYQTKPRNQMNPMHSDMNTAFQYFEQRKNLRAQGKQSEDPDESFLKSILPDMKCMNEHQKRNFKVGILNLAGQILNQPVMVPHLPFIGSSSLKEEGHIENIKEEPTT